MKIFQLHSLVPGVRFYRMVSPAKYLSDRGHEIYYEDTSLEGLESSSWQIRALDPNFHEMLEKILKGVDLIVTQLIHTKQGLAVLEGLRSFFNIPIVLDIDDNVENVPYYNQGGQSYQVGGGLVNLSIQQIQAVDAVTVTTEYLKFILQKYNKNIHVLPNSLDLDIWGSPNGRIENSTLRIGWMGAQTHEDDIKMILPAIEKILRLHGNVRFYFIGGVPNCIQEFKHSRVHSEFLWYDILEYPDRMKQWKFDIGIAPLRDNAFNRAKSNLRWLEFSALGIPSVVSRVEPFNRTVTDGKTALMAYEPEEWIDQLSRLIEDEKLRKRLGKAAYNKVKKDFNVKKNAAKWEAVYEDVIKAGARNDDGTHV